MEHYNRSSATPKAVNIISTIEKKILLTTESKKLQGQINSILNRGKYLFLYSNKYS